MTRTRRIQALAAGSVVAGLAGLYLVNSSVDKVTWQATPANLQQLVGTGSPVQPGDTVTVNAGTYGCVYSGISGTATEPILVKAQPGVLLDGAACTSPLADSGTNVLNIAGADTQWRDFEIGDSDPARFNPNPGSNPANRRPNGVNVTGARTKIIDFYIHDTGDGIGLWGPATDSEVYGTVIARAGWVSTDRAHGHAIYVQNEMGVKRITNTIVLDTYEAGVHAYSTAGQVHSVYFDGLIAASSGAPAANGGPDGAANLLIGTEQNPADDVRVNASVFYQPAGVSGAVRAGYGVGGIGVSITNSYLVGGSQALDLNNWQTATVTGNTFYATAGINRGSGDILAYVRGLGSGAWGGNAYYDRTTIDSSNLRDPFAYNGTVGPDGSQLLAWDAWRTNTGFDANSTYVAAVPPDKVIVQPNAYEPGRSNVTVLNWSRQATRTVDLGGGTWTVYDAGTMTPVASGGAGPVVLPTPAELNVFVVRSLAAPPPTVTFPSTTTTTTTTTTVPGTTTTHPVSTTTVPVTTAPPTTPPPTLPVTTTTRPPCRHSWWQFWKCR